MVSRHVVTMANCIVGVSVLAMPFCFKQCGVVLASILLLLSGIMTRTVCYFLLKASTITRRRTYELLAYHTFGPAGKLVVEISIIGFLVGTLVAFLVVMGDLGPEIVSDIFSLENNSSLRSIIMTALSLFVALPLGLLRNIDSLGGVSSVTMMFYVFLVFKIFSEGMGPLWSGSFLTRINYWRPAGVLQCIPIFSMALSCQTQIFGIYDSLPEPSLHKMNEVVKKAINACTVFYICVGFLGYIAFCTQNFGGNILLSFGPTWSTQLIKICVVLSIAFSFPLVIFPCRASLHSLIFRRVHLHHNLHDITTNYIPEARLKLLTVSIIAFTLCISLLIPNIELVLGLVGSTTGTVICIIFPAVMFFQVTSKNTTERLLAQFICCIGIIIMIVTTYATLFAVEQAQQNDPVFPDYDRPSENFPPKVILIPELVEPKLPILPDIVPASKEKLEEVAQEKKIEPIVPKEETIQSDIKELEKEKPSVDEVKPPDIAAIDKDNNKELPVIVNVEKVDSDDLKAGGQKGMDTNQLVPSKDSGSLKDVVAAKPLQENVAEIAPPVPLKPEVPPPAYRMASRSAMKENLPEEKVVPAPIEKKSDDIPIPLTLDLLKPQSNFSDKNNTRVQSPPVKLKAEDILMKLQEHETMQKKLVEEQKRILDELKQHREEDELKMERSHEKSKKELQPQIRLSAQEKVKETEVNNEKNIVVEVKPARNENISVSPVIKVSVSNREPEVKVIDSFPKNANKLSEKGAIEETARLPVKQDLIPPVLSNIVSGVPMKKVNDAVNKLYKDSKGASASPSKVEPVKKVPDSKSPENINHPANADREI